MTAKAWIYQRAGHAAVVGGALLALTLLGGCVVAPADPYYYGGNNAVVVASQAPPPLQYEAPVAIAPLATQVWIGGYWDWNVGRYEWRQGHWANPPVRGARWVPREWVHGPRGWQARGGHWDRR